MKLTAYLCIHRPGHSQPLELTLLKRLQLQQQARGLLLKHVVEVAGMYGDLAAIAQGPEEALSTSSSLIGWGMCPEGTQQNPVVYAAMSEWAFRSVP